MESEEFKRLQKKALEQLKTGQSLTGKDGVFAPLSNNLLKALWKLKCKVIWMTWNAKPVTSETARNQKP